jgi:SAM-dependent methyltransferase
MLKQVRRAAQSGSELWAEHWRRFDAIRYDAAALRWDGILDLVDARIRTGRMLEAGCGLGRYLLYIHGRGGDAVGIDFASESLARVRQHQPAARVVAGDLSRLPFSGQTFDTILCLGVIEHFEEGARLPLSQLAAALRSSGWLIVTVPYANLLKRRRAARGDGDVVEAEQQLPEGTTFYQYCFTRSEARELLQRAGLNVIRDRRISRLFWLLGGRRGTNRTMAAGEPRAQRAMSRSGSGVVRPLIREGAYWMQWAIPGDLTSHMIVVVGQKPS